MVKNLPANAGDMGSIPRWRRSPWRRKWQPTPVFLPGKFHGQRRLVGYSLGGSKELSMIEHAHTHSSFTLQIISTMIRFCSHEILKNLRPSFTSAQKSANLSSKKEITGISLVVQWLRLCANSAGGPSSIPGQGTRSHRSQFTCCN